VAKQGIARAHFEMVLNSDQTMARVEEAREATYAYTVETTPSVVVDGRYLTSSGMAGGVSELMPIVEGLVQFARQERRSSR
jgi:thiol:disulfide interchange protein DsbA